MSTSSKIKVFSLLCPSFFFVQTVTFLLLCACRAELELLHFPFSFLFSSFSSFFLCSPLCMLIGLFAWAKDAGCGLTMHVFRGLISVQWIIRRDVGSGKG